MGDRGNNRSADAVYQERRHRRSGPLCHPRSPHRKLRGVGARLRARGFGEDAGEARPDRQSHRGSSPQRESGRALLSGDLLVHDDEDPAGERFRRRHRDPEEHHAGHLAPADEQRRLHRLSSTRAGSDAYHPGAVRPIQVGRRGVDAPYASRSGRRDDDEPACRTTRRRALQVFRRLDRPHRQGRSAQAEATTAARRGAQPRGHGVGMVDPGQVSARFDRVGST